MGCAVLLLNITRSVLFCFCYIWAGVIIAAQANIFKRTETQALMPRGLLEAVAFVESGQCTSKKQKVWPWSINVAGKGYTYASKHEAVRAVRAFQLKGVKSIDVGVMQINLKHHPNAFKNLEDAFDPFKNIAYAAQFLKKLFEKYKSWDMAVRYYHSGNAALNHAYLGRVLKAWNTIQKGVHLVAPQDITGPLQNTEDRLAMYHMDGYETSVQTHQKVFPIRMSMRPIRIQKGQTQDDTFQSSPQKSRQIGVVQKHNAPGSIHISPSKSVFFSQAKKRVPFVNPYPQSQALAPEESKIQSSAHKTLHPLNASQNAPQKNVHLFAIG